MAYGGDFADPEPMIRRDRNAIEAFGAVLEGTGRPLPSPAPPRRSCSAGRPPTRRSSTIWNTVTTSRHNTEAGVIEQTAAFATARRRDGLMVARTPERSAAVHALMEQGRSLKAIVRELGLARGTVRRFARTASVDELLAV